MSRFNTGNPIESSDPRDFDDNAKNADLMLNSMEEEWTDRFGRERITLEGGINKLNGVMIAGGRIFGSEAEGRAAVQDGQYYYAESSDPNVSRALFQRTDSSSSRFIANDPSAEFILSIQEIADGAATMAAQPRAFSGDFPGDFDESSVAAIVDDFGTPLLRFNEDGSVSQRLYLDFPGDSPDEPAYRVTDEDGRVLLEIGADGRVSGIFGQSQSAAGLLPYPYDNTLRATGADDYDIAPLGGYSLLSMYPKGANSVAAVIDRAGYSQTSAVVGFPGAGVLVPVNDKTLHVVIGLGQSTMLGASSKDSSITFTPFYPDDVLMFDTGSFSDVRIGITPGDPLTGSTITGFRPLVSVAEGTQGSQGQTSLETMGASLARLCREGDNVGTKRLFFVTARGGTGYSDLRKGSQTYTNMLTALNRAKALADAAGLTLVVDACVLRHAENSAPDPLATYKDVLIEWQSDVENDARQITGQVSRIPMLMCQPSSHYGTFRSALQDMVDMHVESDVHHLVGGDYPYLDTYFTDYLHGTGQWFYYNGEYLARAFKDALWSTHGKSRVVRMLSAQRTGDTVDIQFETPFAPLVFDTSIPQRDVNGFTYADSSGSVTISSASIVNAGASGVGVVRLTLSSTPSGDNERVRYAMNGHSGTREAATVPRGRLRDSCPDVSFFDGRRLYNWAVHQSITVQV